MIVFVTDAGSRKTVKDQILHFAFRIQSLNANLLRTNHVSDVSRHAEAALHGVLLPFLLQNFRIDEHVIVFRILQFRTAHEHPLHDSNLRRRQAYAVGFDHGVNHVTGQGLNVLRHLFHRFAFLCEDLVPFLYDFTNSHCSSYTMPYGLTSISIYIVDFC